MNDYKAKQHTPIPAPRMVHQTMEGHIEHGRVVYRRVGGPHVFGANAKKRIRKEAIQRMMNQGMKRKDAEKAIKEALR